MFNVRIRTSFYEALNIGMGSYVKQWLPLVSKVASSMPADGSVITLEGGPYFGDTTVVVQWLYQACAMSGTR